MGLFAKIFRIVPRDEMNGIHLNLAIPFWEVSGNTDFPHLFSALSDLLPPDCILYFEDGSPSGQLAQFLHEHGVPERTHVAYGTIWPRPAVYHVPATPESISRLSELMSSNAYPELAIHFHVYRAQTVLLEWHDAFDQPMLLSAEFLEPQVTAFTENLKMTYKQGVVKNTVKPTSDS